LYLFEINKIDFFSIKAVLLYRISFYRCNVLFSEVSPAKAGAAPPENDDLDK